MLGASVVAVRTCRSRVSLLILLTDRGVAVMAGIATLPQVRGKGCYRALVRARWDDAVAAGSPNLVVQASDQSGPILAAMGFRGVAELTIVHQTFI